MIMVTIDTDDFVAAIGKLLVSARKLEEDMMRLNLALSELPKPLCKVKLHP